MIIKLGLCVFVAGILSCGNNKEGHVKLQCNYMAYACGDCQPQYKINTVLEAKGFSKEELLDKEIQIVFSDKKFEERLSQKVQNCIICYNFELEGRLSKDSKTYTLYTDSCKVNLKFEDCCNAE